MAQCKANARTDLFRLLDLFLAEAHHGPDGALNPLCGLCGLCASAGVLLGLLGLLANLSADFAGGRFLGIGGFLVDGRRFYGDFLWVFGPFVHIIHYICKLKSL